MRGLLRGRATCPRSCKLVPKHAIAEQPGSTQNTRGETQGAVCWLPRKWSPRGRGLCLHPASSLSAEEVPSPWEIHMDLPLRMAGVFRKGWWWLDRALFRR